MAEEQSSINSNDVEEQSVGNGSKQVENRAQNQTQNLQNGNEQSQNHEVKQENPFSFKHFLNRDASSGSGNNNQSGVCHSRSTSIINGVETSGHPSKSATTSNLNQNHNTGARPKIPQFQSVHQIGGSAANESKMKRSPRFPSFDSQSSLSELSDEKYNPNSMFHSRSNSSFNSEYPVQRSFSNYDMESPKNGGSPKYDRGKSHNSPGPRPQPPVNRLGTSEFSAALPDFVQDHLVLEQWYHGLNSSPNSTSPVSVDLENLPDFTINENRPPYDRVPPRNPSPMIPLDLPARQAPTVDHPPDVTESQRSGAFAYGGMDLNPPGDKIQTLPDFLSDGPIHSSNRLADVTQDTPHFNSPDENSIARLQAENQRLRNELEDSRQIIINQTCRISELEMQLQQRTLQAASEAAAGRGVNGSNNSTVVNKLKQQVKQLTLDLESARRENESLKEEGAVGGVRNNPGKSTRTQQLSRELRLAASSAENNLRQLLAGVDNLRIMAANLESMENTNKRHDPIDEFLSDDDENDFAGPAL